MGLHRIPAKNILMGLWLRAAFLFFGRGDGFPRQCAPQGHLLRGEHWLGMTPLRGVWGDAPRGSRLLGEVLLVMLLQPVLYLRHAGLVPGEVLLHLVLCQLVAEVGLDGGVDELLLFIAGEAVAELADRAGVDKGAAKPGDGQLGELGMHGGHSFRSGYILHYIIAHFAAGV